MNIILFILEIIICLGGITYLYKKHGTEGIYILVIIAIILSNLMTLKAIDIYNYSFYLGIVLNSTIFIILNIIIQKKGKADAMRLLWLIWLTEIFSYVLLSLTGVIGTNFSASESYNLIFGHNLRIFASSTIALIVSLLINIKLYYFLRKEKNKIWISNILGAIIIQFIEALLFVLLGNVFKADINNIIMLIILRYVLKTIICIVGTRTIYNINKIKER